MTTRSTTVRLLAAGWLVLGVSAVALADHHGGFSGGGGGHAAASGGHASGGHGGAAGGRGGYQAGHAMRSPGFASGHSYRPPAVSPRANFAAPASHPWGNAYAAPRAVGATRAFTADHGHGPWGRPGWYGRPHYGAPYYTYVGFLPGYYTTFWWGGIPYYYADSTYYLYDNNVGQYEVVPPPAEASQGGDAAAPAPGDAYVYPNAGQSPEQQSTDRYECHRWATDQTGFDPTQAGGGVAPNQQASANDAYRRAEAACLQGRGYTVR